MILAFFLEGSIQLVPDGTILIHIVLVLLMVAVLNRTLFRPVNRILSERHKKGRETVTESAHIEKRVDEEERRYRDLLRGARASGYKLMQESRTLDLQERVRELALVREEIESHVLKERTSIEKEASVARDEVDISNLGTMIRDRVLKPVQDSGKAN